MASLKKSYADQFALLPWWRRVGVQSLKPGQNRLLKPEQSWEQSGQYAAGTTFAEGLVYFHDRYFLYYGGADSRVGVAEYRPDQTSRAQN